MKSTKTIHLREVNQIKISEDRMKKFQKIEFFRNFNLFHFPKSIEEEIIKILIISKGKYCQYILKDEVFCKKFD